MADRGVLRVLHADDDDSFELLVRRALAVEKLGDRCEFRFVRDGGDAVDYVAGTGRYADRAAHPLPDLILLDQRMRAMDGLDALVRIRRDQTGRRIPIVLFSTATTDALLDACYAAGGTMCVEKPMDFSRLGPMLRHLVDFSITVLGLPDSRP